MGNATTGVDAKTSHGAVVRMTYADEMKSAGERGISRRGTCSNKDG
jgi:hypothetical protein